MQGADSPEWIGKAVRDVYGRDLGRAVGMVFDVAGRPKSVGVETGDALMTILPEQVTSDKDELVVIPQWKLESRHVGLERGVLMKRVSALSRMMREERISRELSDELFARLNELQKSHDVVIARVFSRMEDLARANRAIDEFVSLVTLQYFAGEMGDEKFDLMTKGCGNIKAMNSQEILDIKFALGVEASGEEPDSNLLAELARELGVNKGGPEESSPRIENPSWANAFPPSYADIVQPQIEAGISGKVNGIGSSDEVGADTGYERQRPAIRELENPPGQRLVSPEPKEKSGPETGRLAHPSGPVGSSVDEASDARVSIENPSASEGNPSTAADEGRPESVLGQRVSEWVFAKIVDLEALDIRAGDYRPLKSLEKK